MITVCQGWFSSCSIAILNFNSICLLITSRWKKVTAQKNNTTCEIQVNIILFFTDLPCSSRARARARHAPYGTIIYIHIYVYMYPIHISYVYMCIVHTFCIHIILRIPYVYTSTLNEKEE